MAILRSQQSRTVPIYGLNRVLSFKQAEELQEGLLIAPSSPTIGPEDSDDVKSRAVSFLTFSNGKLEGTTYKAQPQDSDVLRRLARQANAVDRAGVHAPPLRILQASRCAL